MPVLRLEGWRLFQAYERLDATKRRVGSIIYARLNIIGIWILRGN